MNYIHRVCKKYDKYIQKLEYMLESVMNWVFFMYKIVVIWYVNPNFPSENQFYTAIYQ